MPESTTGSTGEPEEPPPSYADATRIVLTPEARTLEEARRRTRQREEAERNNPEQPTVVVPSAVKQEREEAVARWRTQQAAELRNRARAHSIGEPPHSSERTQHGVSDVSSWEERALAIAIARSLRETGATAGPSTAATVLRAGAQQSASQGGRPVSWGAMPEPYELQAVARVALQSTEEPAQSSAKGPANPIGGAASRFSSSQPSFTQSQAVWDRPKERLEGAEERLLTNAAVFARAQRPPGVRRIRHSPNPVGDVSAHSPSMPGTSGPSSQPLPSSVPGPAGQTARRNPSSRSSSSSR